MRYRVLLAGVLMCGMASTNLWAQPGPPPDNQGGDHDRGGPGGDRGPGDRGPGDHDQKPGEEQARHEATARHARRTVSRSTIFTSMIDDLIIDVFIGPLRHGVIL